MKKMSKAISCMLAMVMSASLLTGCGKDKAVDTKSLEEVIDKYSGYCTELAEYTGIEYTNTYTEITDEMVQSQIDSLISKGATSEQVTSGTAEEGDTVNIKFVGSVDGVEFEGGSSDSYDLTLGSGSMIDGFEEQIEGHDVGETFDIYTTFPESYSNNPDLAGQDAVFEITINYITVTTNPEYNDAFVASNTDCTTVDEYEAKVLEDLTSSYAKSDESANKSAILTTIIDNSTVSEYPEQEMQEYIDSTVASVQSAAASYGYDLETYVMYSYGFSSEADFMEYISDTVESFMKEKIVVCAIAKKEGITVTDENYESYEKEVMESYGYADTDTLYENYSKEDILYYALAENVTNFLLENAVPVEATTTDAAIDTTATESDASDIDTTTTDAE